MMYVLCIQVLLMYRVARVSAPPNYGTVLPRFGDPAVLEWDGHAYFQFGSGFVPGFL